MAVARYEGAEGSTSAELAMVVDDDLQRTGVGRLMLDRLLDVAVEAGLHRIVADVLSQNSPMLRLLRSTGLPTRTVRDDGFETVTVDISSRAGDAERRARARAHIAAARRPASLLGHDTRSPHR